MLAGNFGSAPLSDGFDFELKRWQRFQKGFAVGGQVQETISWVAKTSLGSFHIKVASVVMRSTWIAAEREGEDRNRGWRANKGSFVKGITILYLGAKIG